MFERVTKEGMTKSGMSKLKSIIFGNNLIGESGITRKEQCVLTLPFKTLIFRPSKLECQGENSYHFFFFLYSIC